VKSQSLQLRQELSLARHDWVYAFVNFSMYFLFVAIPRVDIFVLTWIPSEIQQRKQRDNKGGHLFYKEHLGDLLRNTLD